jgi:hypothetical protein
MAVVRQSVLDIARKWSNFDHTEYELGTYIKRQNIGEICQGHDSVKSRVYSETTLNIVGSDVRKVNST